MSLTLRDAARMLNLSERALQAYIEKGDFPSRCVGGRTFLNRDELIEWATAHGFPVASAAVSALPS